MQTLATTLCWTVLVLGNLLELLSYKWQQNVSFWWSTFPVFWGQTCRNQTHIWVCVWKIHMALGTHEIAPARGAQPGQPDTWIDVGSCWVGMFTLLACGTALCLHVHVCLFSRQALPSCPALSGAVPPLANVPASPREISWELPLMFSSGFPWGKSKCFLGKKWWALRSAEVEKLKMASSSAAGWWSEGSIFTCLVFAQRHPCTTFCCSWSLSSVW